MRPALPYGSIVGRYREFALALLARCGYVACSVLYVWLGLLVCEQSMTGRGRADFAGTLIAAKETGGTSLLMALACGFWGYAVWRWTEAARNPEHRPLWSRIDIATRGAIYGWLGVTATKFAITHSIDIYPVRHAIDIAFTYPGGHALVFAAGLLLVVFVWTEVGVAIRGIVSGHLANRFSLCRQRHAVRFLSRLGMVGRAAAFGTVAYALLRTSLWWGPVDADMGDLYAQLTASPLGRAFALATGTGLIAYGGYLEVLAWCRRMPS